MSRMVSQNTSLTIVHLIIYSGTDQRKHQSSVSLAYVQGIHQWPVNSLHKWTVMRKINQALPMDHYAWYLPNLHRAFQCLIKATSWKPDVAGGLPSQWGSNAGDIVISQCYHMCRMTGGYPSRWVSNVKSISMSYHHMCRWDKIPTNKEAY